MGVIAVAMTARRAEWRGFDDDTSSQASEKDDVQGLKWREAPLQTASLFLPFLPPLHWARLVAHFSLHKLTGGILTVMVCWEYVLPELT